MNLIEKHPEFKPLYDTLFNLCENIEGVMNMFSKELYELDRNTSLLMVDEYGKRVAKLEEDIAEKDKIITEISNTIAEKDNTIAKKDNTIAELMAKIKELEGK